MDYQSAYDQLASAYNPQTDLVNQQIAQLAPQQQAQQAGLDQAKVNAFKDITNQSNSRGVLFSGVPIDQQATYVGTKYLPAVADLNTSFNNQKTTLLGQLNSLNADRSKTAQSNVVSYLQAQSDAAYKQAQLQLGYAKLGASGNKAPTQAQLQSAVTQHIIGQFGSAVGADKKVSNETWANGLNDWLSAGGKAADFWANFGQYVNRNYANKYAGYQDGFGGKYTT